MTAAMHARLVEKLKRIRSGTYVPGDFIIADAKDAEMGGGIAALGTKRLTGGTERPATSTDYRQAMIDMMASGLIDIMLTSMSSAEVLADSGAFNASKVTQAIRLNDATDIWELRGASYRKHPALPFRTAKLHHARRLAALGLYAVTFYNDRDLDVTTLEAYGRFRQEAETAGIAHFLEVFNPAFPIDTGRAELGAFVNDAIVRCLAGVERPEAPLFLKMQFNGARAMEEIHADDPSNHIIGELWGDAGPKRETF